MGKFNQGINGPFVGRVGNIVASSWRGIPYLKSRPVRKKPPTEKEKLSRHVFAMTQLWLNPIVDYVRAGFKNPNPRLRGIHAAKSYLYKHALVRDGYNSFVDPSRMLISQGDLSLGEGFEMRFDQATSEVFVSWNPQLPVAREGEMRAAHDDQLMILAYNIEAGEAYGQVNGVPRRIGFDRIPVLSQAKSTYHVYVAFLSGDRSCQSDSLYLGEIEMGE